MPNGSRNGGQTACSATSPALILCVGPYVRYEELERYSGLVDLVLSEATAADVLPRHVARLLDGRPSRMPRAGTRSRCSSARGQLERRIVLTPSPRRVPRPGIASNRPTTRGRRPPPATRRASRSGETLLTVWDVPVLEEWTERLEAACATARARSSRLMGFPDRNTVALAKSKGAIACLELPLNLDDLVDVIDRFAHSPRPRHPRPRRPGRTPPLLPPRPRRRLADAGSPTNPMEWPVPVPDAYNCK